MKVSFIDADGYAESVGADPTTAVGERAHKFWTATVDGDENNYRDY